MGNKNGFNPAISSGTQRFEHLGQWATVCYWGYSLLAYSYGDRVFFQNQYGQYWLGMIERDCFVLMCETPLRNVIEGLSYLDAEYHMHQIHGDDWFCSQGELPF